MGVRFSQVPSVIMFVFFSLNAAAFEDQSRPLHIPMIRGPQTWKQLRLRSQAHQGGPMDPALDKLSRALAADLATQFKKVTLPLQHPVKDCRDPSKLHSYQHALRTMGRYKECQELASSCQAVKNGQADLAMQDVFFEAAVCAESHFDFPQALSRYNQATQAKFLKAPHFQGTLYQFGKFAYFTQYSNLVPALLSRNPIWTSNDIRLIIASYDILRNGFSTRAAPEEVLLYVRNLLAKSKDEFLIRRLLTDEAFFLIHNRFQYVQAGQLLAKYASLLTNPDEWQYLAYSSIYGNPSPNFHLAARIYKEAAPYLHPQSSFPVESNTANYSELYAVLCKNRLTHDSQYNTLAQIKAGWLRGYTTWQEALDKALALNNTSPGKADVLSVIGGLYEANGNDQQAAGFYWQAHKACPRYNRSHWGLHNVFLRKRDSLFGDYAANLARVDRELQNVRFPPEFSSYVFNWKALNPVAQKRLMFATRFWAPYIKYLYGNRQSLYVKQTFQLLSELPGTGDARDVRVEGPGYENDQRLWDDIRGSGGPFVNVDWSEMMEAPFGAYNLAGHEMTHQFHFILPAEQAACVDKLYANAKANGKFAEPYSASNQYEYFAQAVAYFMIPADSPERFGLNVQWFIDNDKPMFQFLLNIQSANGAVESIRCPL